MVPPYSLPEGDDDASMMAMTKNIKFSTIQKLIEKQYL